MSNLILHTPTKHGHTFLNIDERKRSMEGRVEIGRASVFCRYRLSRKRLKRLGPNDVDIGE